MKIKFLLTLAIVSALFMGCKKDDNSSSSIAGTTWSRSYEEGTQVLEFINGTSCQLFQTDASGNIKENPSQSTYSIAENGSITFKQPFGFSRLSGVILPISSDIYGVTSATISGNTMRVTATREYWYYVYYNGEVVDIVKEKKDYSTFTFRKTE